jgi:NADPH-dependent glutamate synthase beta subunit-like oxidoreductase
MALRETASKLPVEPIRTEWGGNRPAIEAAWCLSCFDAPCTIECLTHLDVPGFNKEYSRAACEDLTT